MRIEQLIGNYTGFQNRLKGNKGRRRRSPPFPGAAGHATIDMICLSTDDIEQDFGWVGAYVRGLPDDIVVEKVRQIFCKLPTDDFLVEKLMFEVF